MALKFKLKSKDEIPAEFQSLYVERDGAFVLDVDGVADISKLDEFRTNNVGLVKQLDDLKKKFEGIDPEKVRDLEAEKLRLEEAQAAAGPGGVKRRRERETVRLSEPQSSQSHNPCAFPPRRPKV